MLCFLISLILVFAPTDLFAIVKSNRNSENPSITELCRIGKNFYKHASLPIPSCKQLDSLKLPEAPKGEFSIQSNSILFDGKLENCLRGLKQINREIRNANNHGDEFITLKYGGETYIFNATPLGVGERGVVYPLFNKKYVIKIPKNDLKSMRILQEEKASSDFWYEISQNSHINFSVPKKVKEHPLGFFSIMERIDGQTLTDVLIRFNIVRIDKQQKTASIPPRVESHRTQTSMNKIAQAIMDLVRTFQKNPEFSLSISPNNILVTFSDEKMEQVNKVYLIDFGLDSGYHTNYGNTKDFEDYLDIARLKIQGYLARYPTQFNF